MSNQCGGQAERPPSQEEDYADVEKPKPKNAITAMGFFTRVKKETFKRNHHNEKLNHPEFTKQCTAEWKVRLVALFFEHWVVKNCWRIGDG